MRTGQANIGQRADRRHVDNATIASGTHARCKVAAHIKSSVQIDRKYLPPFVRRDVQNIMRAALVLWGDRRIVYEYGDGSEGDLQPGARPGALCIVGYVRHHAFDRASGFLESFYRSFQRCAVVVDQAYGSAGGGEPTRQNGTDPARGAGDNDGLTPKIRTRSHRISLKLRKRTAFQPLRGVTSRHWKSAGAAREADGSLGTARYPVADANATRLDFPAMIIAFRS